MSNVPGNDEKCTRHTGLHGYSHGKHAVLFAQLMRPTATCKHAVDISHCLKKSLIPAASVPNRGSEGHAADVGNRA